MLSYHWERETVPVLGEVYLIYGLDGPLAFAADANAAQKIVDALNATED